jgi:hypothetical protein
MLAVTVGAGLARDWRRGRLNEVGTLSPIAGKARSYRWINKTPESIKSQKKTCFSGGFAAVKIEHSAEIWRFCMGAWRDVATGAGCGNRLSRPR